MSLQRFTIIQTSDFNLYNRWLSSENIEPVCEQRASLGFNSPRIWTAYQIGLIGRLIPREHPGFYDRIPAFMEVLAGYGFYPEWTAFTGPYGAMFDTSHEMVHHWESLQDALLGLTNLLDLELVNEYDNPPNHGLPYDRLHRPVGLRSSHGSAVQDAAPKEPVWDVAGHRPGGNEWQRKVGHNAMADVADVYHIPSWCNETIRMPDNDSNPIHAFDAAAGAALLCAGSCFHSPEGKNSTLWTGRSLQCAQAWANGARSVPLEFQAGAYFHPNDGEYLRRYGRRLPDGREYIVSIRY